MGWGFGVGGYGLERQRMEQGHKKLEIYQLAHSLAVKVHQMTLSLPAMERFEEGSQIRRSAKSIPANIVEGYALRRYKNEFVHFLFRAYGSSQETLEHLEMLFDTGSLANEDLFKLLRQDYDLLCGKILRYIQAVDRQFELPNFMKEPDLGYDVGGSRFADNPESTLQTSDPEAQRIDPKTQITNPKPQNSL